MSNMKTGFYWVKFEDGYKTIVEIRNDGFVKYNLIGNECEFHYEEGDFEIISKELTQYRSE